MILKKIQFSTVVYTIVCISPFLGYLENNLLNTYIPLSLEIIYIFLYVYKRKWIIKPVFFLFIVWISCITLINYSGNITAVNRMIGEIVSLLTLVIISQDSNGYKFLEIYKIIAKACLGFFIIQVILMYTFGFPMQFTISFLPVKDELEYSFNILSYYSKESIYIRFPGPFSEPSHYAAYLTPLLFMELFNTKKIFKEKWFISTVISITMILSTSGIGIVLCCITWLFYFIFEFSTVKNRLLLLPILFIFGLLLFIFLLIYNDQFYITISNLFFVTDKSRFAGGSKADFRIYRGFASYFKLPLLNKIFGVGFANMNNFALSHNINTIYDISAAENIEYYNGISQILLYTGFFGFILWIRELKRYSKKISKQGKILLAIYIFYLIGSGTLFGTYASIFLASAALFEKNVKKEI